MPMTKFWGRTATGLGQSNDADERFYEEMIAHEQHSRMKPQIMKVYPVLCASLFGEVPDDLDVDFPSVRVLTEEEKAEMAEKGTAPVLAGFNSGIYGRKTVLQEMQQLSDRTGIFTNITKKQVEEASDEPEMAGEEWFPGGGEINPEKIATTRSLKRQEWEGPEGKEKGNGEVKGNTLDRLARFLADVWRSERSAKAPDQIPVQERRMLPKKTGDEMPKPDARGTRQDVLKLMEHRSFRLETERQDYMIFSRHDGNITVTVRFRGGEVLDATLTQNASEIGSKNFEGKREAKSQTRQGFQGLFQFAQMVGDASPSFGNLTEVKKDDGATARPKGESEPQPEGKSRKQRLADSVADFFDALDEYRKDRQHDQGIPVRSDLEKASDQVMERPPIAIDFDGVMAKRTKQFEPHAAGDPIEKGFKLIEQLRIKGENPYILTARTDFDFVQDWLLQRGCHIEVTNQKKPGTAAVIDDRAVDFENASLDEILSRITRKVALDSTAWASRISELLNQHDTQEEKITDNASWLRDFFWQEETWKEEHVSEFAERESAVVATLEKQAEIWRERQALNAELMLAVSKSLRASGVAPGNIVIADIGDERIRQIDREQREAVESFAAFTGVKATIYFGLTERPRSYSVSPEESEREGGEVWLKKGTPPASVWHELGHWLEMNTLGGPEAAKSFRDGCRGKEQAAKLSDLTGDPCYEPDEVAFKDKFPDAYCGRLYEDDATEITSMGMQCLQEDVGFLLATDKEYFDFVLEMVAGHAGGKA
jgi:hypothetical protein